MKYMNRYREISDVFYSLYGSITNLSTFVNSSEFLTPEYAWRQNVDMDSLTTPGWYAVQSFVNGPSAAAWDIVSVVGRYDTIRQIVYGQHGDLYARSYQSNKWSSWETISSQSSGTIPMTLALGGTSCTCDGQISWTKVGKIVYLSQAFWNLTITNPTSDNMQFKLPFKCTSVRAIGTCGYNNSGNDLFPVATSGSNIFGFCKRNENGSTTDIKGNAWNSCILQWNMVYVTDGTVVT